MSETTLWFGVLSPRSAGQRTLSPRTWTCIGALAIPLWATWPSLAIRTFDIPPLESLSIMFFFGWLVLMPLHRPEPGSVDERLPGKLSWLPALVFAIGLSGGDVAFLLATHRIPAAQANLISYLWPVMIVVFGAAIGLFRLRLRQVIGLALGFGGAVILVWDGRISMSISGIGLALL